MANKFFKIGIAILSIVFGIVEAIDGSKDLIEAIKENPEENSVEKTEKDEEAE